jgi:hypothetical protein
LFQAWPSGPWLTGSNHPRQAYQGYLLRQEAGEGTGGGQTPREREEVRATYELLMHEDTALSAHLPLKGWGSTSRGR